MTTTRLRAAVALSFAVIAASACGGDSGGGPTFSDSVSTADAQDAAAGAISDVGTAIGQLNFGTGSIGLAGPAFIKKYAPTGPLMAASIGGHSLTRQIPLFDLKTLAAQGPTGLQASASEGCTITESGFQNGGGVVDVDQNGYPDNLYIKQECLTTDSTSNPDTTFQHYVVIEEHLTQNFAALWGFNVTFNYLEKYSDDFGNFEQQSARGGEALDIRSASARHHFEFVFGEGAKFDTSSAAFEAGTNWSADFAPGADIVWGDPLPNGDLTLTGRDYVTDTENQNLSFSLSTTTPLAYSASCYAADSNPPFTAGVLRGLLNNNANSAHFTATFTACGVAPTVTTGGTHDPSAVAMQH